MSNDFTAGLFLLAFWLPPLAVIAGALALFARMPKVRRGPLPMAAARASH